MHEPDSNRGKRSRAALLAALCAAALGPLSSCKGSIDSPRDPGAPGSGGDGQGTVAGESPLDPGALAAACTVDQPFPRRVIRLAPAEYLATLSRLAPIEDSGLPPGFEGATLRVAGDPSLAVSRDFQESADALARRLAEAVVTAPPAGLIDCPVARFGADAACTRGFVERAQARLFPGGADPEERDALVRLAGEAAGVADGAGALATVVRALALSPRALYFTEGVESFDAGAPARPVRLSAGELARFLSSRFAMADGGEDLVNELRALRPGDEAGLTAIVDRRFPAAAVAQGLSGFLAGLLNVEAIPRLQRSRELFPQADATFLQALQRETLDALSALAAAPGTSFERLLTEEQRSQLLADAGNPALDGVGRPGVFTLPGVLASISGSDHTNIPRRGRFLLRQLVCESVPPPPPTLDLTLPPLPGTPSDRERFERVESEPACGGCHGRVDPMGFALEAYDPLGQVRAVDQHSNPIRTDGVHRTESGAPLVFSGPRALFAEASRHPVARACFVIQTFRHVARRLERGSQDACLVAELSRQAEVGGYRLVDLYKRAVVRAALAERAN